MGGNAFLVILVLGKLCTLFVVEHFVRRGVGGFLTGTSIHMSSCVCSSCLVHFHCVYSEKQ